MKPKPNKKPITHRRLYTWAIKQLEPYMTWLEVAKHERAGMFAGYIRDYEQRLVLGNHDSMRGSPTHNDSPASQITTFTAIRRVRDARAWLFTDAWSLETQKDLEYTLKRHKEIRDRMNSQQEVSMMEALSITPIYGTSDKMGVSKVQSRQRNSFDP